MFIIEQQLSSSHDLGAEIWQRLNSKNLAAIWNQNDLTRLGHP